MTSSVCACASVTNLAPNLIVKKEEKKKTKKLNNQRDLCGCTHTNTQRPFSFLIHCLKFIFSSLVGFHIFTVSFPFFIDYVKAGTNDDDDDRDKRFIFASCGGILFDRKRSFVQWLRLESFLGRFSPANAVRGGKWVADKSLLTWNFRDGVFCCIFFL